MGGIVVEAEAAVAFDGRDRALAEAMSKAISVGCTSRRN